MPCNAARRVHNDLVGHRGKIVHSLRVLITVGNHELTALLERSKLTTYLFKRSCLGLHHSGLQIYTLDILILLGLLY